MVDDMLAQVDAKLRADSDRAAARAAEKQSKAAPATLTPGGLL